MRYEPEYDTECPACEGEGTVECECVECHTLHRRPCGACNGSGVRQPKPDATSRT